MAERHQEFLQRGARVYALSADSPGQNAAVVEKLDLPFPILSDPDRDRAITPLGFADEEDRREIARPGTVIVTPDGEIAFRTVGRDYADRPEEEDLLEALSELDLPPTNQEPPAVANPQPGETAVPFPSLRPYFRGVTYTTYALHRRHRDLDEEFAADVKAYGMMANRYLEALTAVEARKA